MEKTARLRMILNLLGGNSDKVEADTRARMQEADNGGWPFPADPLMAQFETEDYCIGSALRDAILDVYFGGMSRETAIALRDALGDYGTVCIYNGCDGLAFSGEQVAANYNARHPDNQNDRHFAGWAAFEI